MKRDLSNSLQSLLTRYDRQFLPGDPVFSVHRYSNPRDQELVGFIASLLAFGNAKAIRRSLEKLLTLLGPSPFSFVYDFDPARERAAFQSLGHRWVRGGDLHLLLILLKKILRRHSSLKACFLEGYEDRDVDVAPMLNRFSRKVKSLVNFGKQSRGFRYFFPQPSDGSACKRLNMYLRWMVRPADGIDLGLWKEIPPSKLVIPLDTHVYRFGRRFRLSRFKTPHWRFARDVTDFLKNLDPEDPVKYDFAICHYGMEKGW